MNSPPKFAIPRFDVHQSSRVQHLCFLSSTFSRATIGVVVQVSRAHFLTPLPLSLISSVMYEIHNKRIFWFKLDALFAEKWRINWKTKSSIAFGREWERSDVNLGNFWLQIFWTLPPRAHRRTRENDERYLFSNWISPIIIKEYLCERLNNTHTRIAKCRRRRRLRALSLGAARRRLCTPPRRHHLRMLKWYVYFFFRSFNSLSHFCLD